MHKFMNVTCKLLIRSHTLSYAKAHLGVCLAYEKRMHNVPPTYKQRTRSVCNECVAHWSAFGILYIKMEGIGNVFMIK